MPWSKGVLLFTVAVVTLGSSLRVDPDTFSEAGVAYGAVSVNMARFGKLLIGGQDAASNNNVKTSALSLAESHGHQSNEEVFHPASSKLYRLGSSVRCSNNSMILRIPGQRMPHFLVDREESPVPLSEMPASCGFSLKRARRDVSLVAPYRGCHVRKQGGSYILPLIIMGAPVQVSCPVRPLLPTVSCFSSGMIVKFGIRVDDVKVKVDGTWQPLLQKYTQCSFTLEITAGSLVVTAPFTGSCWEVTDTERQLPLMYGDQEVTLSCPLTPPTVAPTLAPTTPAVRDPTEVQQMFDPFHFGRPWWYPYPGDPAAPPAPQPQYPWYPNFPTYMNGFQSPVEVTTPATTTTAPYQPEHQYPGYPMYPPFYGPQPIKSFVPPTVKYPFMPQYPKDPIFGPRSRKSRSSPALLSSVYRSRR
uniref:Zona pellucida sperm-binding protein 1/4 Ig-like domain-containing protein n=1 Tax=Cyprinus carpio TaxID=7962 RepID=A0A8C1UHH9_CYPCA